MKCPTCGQPVNPDLAALIVCSNRACPDWGIEQRFIPEPGWLKRQLKAAAQNVQELPAWLK